MKIRNLIFCGMMVLVMASCTTKQSVINQLENFSYELRDNSRNYGVKDWEKAGKKFVKISNKVKKFEKDYTSEERVRIAKLEGECAVYMAKGAKDNVSDILRGLFNDIKGIIDGVKD